jgi:cardiolipin synthase
LLILLALLSILPLAGRVADLVAPDHAGDLAGDLAAAQAPVDTAAFLLCVDGPEFMAALSRDLAASTDRAWVQTLTFEADAAGLALAAALVASPARDRRLLIDSYSRLVQSDKLLCAPTRLLDVELGEEARRTLRLVEHLQDHGVQVSWGRPYGPGCDNLAPRDHKKLMICDDAAYVGGINFSEHNFLWHDLMVRTTTPGAADALAADFARSWSGEPATTHVAVPGLELVLSAGDGDTAVERRLAAAIGSARERLVLECPYVTEPYFALLGAARARGVAVTVVTSELNNRLCMKQSIMEACARHDLELRLLPGRMTHVKALWIDGERLLLGSANFDFLSARLQPEVVAVIDDPGLLADYERRVLAPSLADSERWPSAQTDPVLAGLSAGVIGLARRALEALHR